jgi:hypothetical protein
MALADAEVAASLHTVDDYQSETMDAISVEHAELYHFIKLKKVKQKFNHGGRQVRWLYVKGRGTISGLGRNSTFDIVRVNREAEAVLGNKGYAIFELVHMTDLLENKGPEARISHLEELAKGIRRDFGRVLAYSVYDVGGSNSTWANGLGFIGADGALLESTGMYAGVDVSTTDGTPFRSNVSSASPLTLFTQNPKKALNYIIRTCTKGAKDGMESGRPDVIFMTREMYDYVHEMFTQLMIVGYDRRAPIDGKFIDSFVYKGVTFYPTDTLDGTQTNNLYAFNTEDMDYLFPTGQFINPKRWEDQFPMSTIMGLWTYGLFRFKNPRLHGRFTIA